jgi:rhamnosyltransferase
METHDMQSIEQSASAGSMIDRSVCAVIVTYHPSLEMLAAIPLVLQQVQGLVVVDNGSSSSELALLRAANESQSFALIENGENLGVAEALNQGVRWAQSRGFSWVVLFDQDSKITDRFIGNMFARWNSHPLRERIGSLHPLHTDPETGVAEIIERRAKDGGPVIAITSGALMPIWIFDKIGMFASEYFVDEVDAEYSFRIRAAGYLLADSPQAVLLHKIGHPKKASLFGFSFTPTHHSALRRYYMTRNRVVLYRKYLPVFPGWVLQAMHVSLKDTIKCLIGEEDRGSKFRSVLQGTWDGLIGRMGKREMR